MTIVQAAELRMKWQRLIHPPPCEHLKLDRVWIGTGTLRFEYCCRVCGDPVHN